MTAEQVRRPLVYIACPITAGNRNWNYFQSIEAERELMEQGFAPQNPAHSMVLPFAWQATYPHQMWLDCCFSLIDRCDALLRLPGYSVGADAECSHAAAIGVPIFYSVEDLSKWKQVRQSVTAKSPTEPAPCGATTERLSGTT